MRLSLLQAEGAVKDYSRINPAPILPSYPIKIGAGP